MIAQTCVCPDPHCAIHGVPVKTTFTVSTLPDGAVYAHDLAEASRNDPNRQDAMKRAAGRVDRAILATAPAEPPKDGETAALIERIAKLRQDHSETEWGGMVFSDGGDYVAFDHVVDILKSARLYAPVPATTTIAELQRTVIDYVRSKDPQRLDDWYLPSTHSDPPAPVPAREWQWTDAEKLARRFHEIYERLAPSFGYETRTETREFRRDTKNGALMIAVCAEILEYRMIPPPAADK